MIRKITINYVIECEKCAGQAVLEEIADFGLFGKKALRYKCKKCGKINWRFE